MGQSGSKATTVQVIVGQEGESSDGLGGSDGAGGSGSGDVGFCYFEEEEEGYNDEVVGPDEMFLGDGGAAVLRDAGSADGMAADAGSDNDGSNRGGGISTTAASGGGTPPPPGVLVVASSTASEAGRGTPHNAAARGGTNTNTAMAVVDLFQDHYSLGESTTLRFRSRALRIFNDGPNRQLVLLEHQDDCGPQPLPGAAGGGGGGTGGGGGGGGSSPAASVPSPPIPPAAAAAGRAGPSAATSAARGTTATAAVSTTMHVTHTSNFGMALLRTVYTLVSLFVLTVIFCFNVQTILFLFMNLVGVETAQSWDEDPPTLSVIGATLAVPLLLYSAGSMMTLSWSFVVDCWNGMADDDRSLLRQMVSSWTTSTTTEWTCLVIFLLVPLVAMTVSTMAKNDDWWEISILSWAIGVGCFQGFYMLLAFLNEVHICSALLKKFMPNVYDSRDVPKWVKLVDTSVLLTQRQKWSGLRHERYLVHGTDVPPSRGFSADPSLVPVQWNLKLGTRLTLMNGPPGSNGWNTNCYRVLHPPVRNYSMDEVFGNVMFLTNWNWSLERLWCMDRGRGAAFTLTGRGPASVTANQMTNGYVCIVAGSVVVLIVIAGLLIWADQSPVATSFILFLVFVFCLFPMNFSSYLVFRFHRHHRSRASKSSARREYVDEHDLLLTEEEEEGPHVSIINKVQASSQEPSSSTQEAGAAKQQGDVEEQTQATEKAAYDDPANTASSKHFTTKSGRIPSMAQGDATSKANSNRQKSGSFSSQSTTTGESDSASDINALISVWESVRVTEAQPWFCWATAGLEVTVFYLWPLISLSVTGNGPVAIVFGVVGAFSVVRHYYNVSNLLQELGPISGIDLGSTDLQPAFCGLGGGGGRRCCTPSRSSPTAAALSERSRKLKNQALVAAVVRRVTRARATRNWIVVFFLLFLCVFVGFLMASTEDSFDYKVKGVVFVDDFYYESQPQLPYPTCSVQKGFAFPGLPGQSASLADYAFLATQSFSGPDEAQPNLDQWFGPGTVVDEYQFVAAYREATETADNPVSYKFFTFPSIPGAGIVSIRGSEAMWDWMVDIQLWTGGALAQLVRAVNPFGYMWDPILDDVVWLINSVQSKKLKEVSYYRYTSKFVEDMYGGNYDGRQYDELRVTGASLGGGLAILTGAITGASAVALSGLNAMYSRRTFDPPITADQLNTRVFNVIPDFDVIAHVDVPGDLYQRIQCRGPKNTLFGCHHMMRSLCEIQYQCGSGTRPINCWCVSKYGYPQPVQNGTVTWEEACADSDR